MRHTIKNIYTTIAALLVATVGYADSGEGYSSPSANNYSSCAPACYQGPTCCDTCDFGIYGSADLLYWRANESGLNLCIPTEASTVTTSDFRVISTNKTKLDEPNYRWTPGFRLGLGYEIPDSCWDLAVFWTHFNSSASKSHDDEELKWRLHYDVVDLVAIYQYNCHCFAVKPFAGLRGARIDQTVHISADDSEDLTSVSIHNKEEFFGVGPIVGIEADWCLGCGFSLYAQAALSLLYGDYDMHFSDSNRFVDGASFSHLKQDVHAIQVVGDAGLGVRWERCFCNNLLLVLKLGVEEHLYFDHNRIGDCGDLSLGGAVFSAGLAF